MDYILLVGYDCVTKLNPGGKTGNGPFASNEFGGTVSGPTNKATHFGVRDGLVVGILEMLFAFIFYGLILAAKPMRFQTVAAGLLGRAPAYEDGIKTFLLGILLDFVVASCIASVDHRIANT